MTCLAEVVCDSISTKGIRITTVRLTYPKFIHGELMTHRVFSRNAGSSRAIPVKRLLSYIDHMPAEPIHWGLNEKGMQASKEATGLRRWILRRIWRSARKAAVRRAWWMDFFGGHKQIVNRLVETHGHINVLVTSTHWANFHALRDHKDAQPEIRVLSQAIQLLMGDSKPKLLLLGEWHLPYITPYDRENVFDDSQLQQISAARCARTSYVTMDGKPPSMAEDFAVFKKLAGGSPIHASPLEHIATPDIYDEGVGEWVNKNLWGNFYGWCQYRKFVPGESTKESFEAPDQGAPGLPAVPVNGGGVHHAPGDRVLRELGDSPTPKIVLKFGSRNLVTKKRTSRKSNRGVRR